MLAALGIIFVVAVAIGMWYGDLGAYVRNEWRLMKQPTFEPDVSFTHADPRCIALNEKRAEAVMRMNRLGIKRVIGANPRGGWEPWHAKKEDPVVLRPTRKVITLRPRGH